jgi:ABC-type dipeptide/oligopeptide/nickel transport system permease subunit
MKAELPTANSTSKPKQPLRVTVGAVLIVIISFLALFGVYLTPHNPYSQNLSQALSPPSLNHPFGTDVLGRDVLARTFLGGRFSLAVGILSVFLMLAIGLPAGGLSGYFSGWIDASIMRLADFFLSFPLVIGALLFAVAFGHRPINLTIAFGLLGWPYIARIFRSSVAKIKQLEYIEAARLVGASHPRIIFLHILPNAIAPALAYACLMVGMTIAGESILSFLGLGLSPPHPSWGTMLAESIGQVGVANWLMYFPGLSITITVLGFTLIGDGWQVYLGHE